MIQGFDDPLLSDHRFWGAFGDPPSAMKKFPQGAPIVGGPSVVESYREVTGSATMLTTSHDGYLSRFGVVHRRVLMVAEDGNGCLAAFGAKPPSDDRLGKAPISSKIG